MDIDVQSRGFSLTRALQQAIEEEARRYASRSARALSGIRVRLFDVNGPRGGSDKTCLVQASLRRRQSVVASHVDGDLYRAIAVAFAKLERGTRSALALHRARRRASGSWLDTAGP